MDFTSTKYFHCNTSTNVWLTGKVAQSSWHIKWTFAGVKFKTKKTLLHQWLGEWNSSPTEQMKPTPPTKWKGYLMRICLPWHTETYLSPITGLRLLLNTTRKAHKPVVHFTETIVFKGLSLHVSCSLYSLFSRHTSGSAFLPLPYSSFPWEEPHCLFPHHTHYSTST